MHGCCSVAQLCLSSCNTMDSSMPGFLFHHHIKKMAQFHVHSDGDDIQASSPLSSTSSPAFNLSQHQGLFHLSQFFDQVDKVLEFQFQHQSFQWIVRIDFLQDWLVWSPCSLGDSQVSTPTSQFKSINSLVLSFLYSPTLISIHHYWKNCNFDYIDIC